MAWTEDQRANLSKLRGQAATYIKDPQQRAKYVSEQGAAEAAHSGKVPDAHYERMKTDAENTIALQGENKTTAMASYKHGTTRVPNTGPAVLHKDEAVLNKDDADNYRAAKGHMSQKHDIMADLADSMGGKKHPKKIKEIRTRKAKSGGYIHEHHHTHPAEHPMEEHTSPDQNAMAAHMMEHMGGEAAPAGDEADAGQGMPGAAPAAGAVAGL